MPKRRLDSDRMLSLRSVLVPRGPRWTVVPTFGDWSSPIVAHVRFNDGARPNQIWVVAQVFASPEPYYGKAARKAIPFPLPVGMHPIGWIIGESPVALDGMLPEDRFLILHSNLVTSARLDIGATELAGRSVCCAFHKTGGDPGRSCGRDVWDATTRTSRLL
jgi:hypothetical protein